MQAVVPHGPCSDALLANAASMAAAGVAWAGAVLCKTGSMGAVVVLLYAWRWTRLVPVDSMRTWPSPSWMQHLWGMGRIEGVVGQIHLV